MKRIMDDGAGLHTCLQCGKRERIQDVNGVQLSNLSPYSRVCIECINFELDPMQKQNRRGLRKRR